MHYFNSDYYINIILIVNTYIHPENIPGVFGMRPVIVLSGSMEPEFMSGDLIFIQDGDVEQLKRRRYYMLYGRRSCSDSSD